MIKKEKEKECYVLIAKEGKVLTRDFFYDRDKALVSGRYLAKKFALKISPVDGSEVFFSAKSPEMSILIKKEKRKERKELLW